MISKKKMQIRLFQTKMFCGPLQNTSVAHRWDMAHRLKTTELQAKTGQIKHKKDSTCGQRDKIFEQKKGPSSMSILSTNMLDQP